ncbi:unnamed protein product [Hyaloperonospora brassicae]|uniref:RxLR effector candidate protein n=1 Tax=Hyaloperonospora brassicae TaxID=162125 RepID=A0AAV0TE64_HYABA|nr:unnamed protein product [Hyaloperonospora brassicae]
MSRPLFCVAGIALLALLVALTAAVLRLLLLVVHLVTPRYTLMLGSLAFALWFGVSRRQRCARGFYSCSQKVATTPPSETESEDDENEATAGRVSSGSATLVANGSAAPSPFSSVGQDKRLVDVRTRRDPLDDVQQQRRPSRPRSSSAADDIRSSLVPAGSTDSCSRVDAEELEPKRVALRRRADTSMTTTTGSTLKQPERMRRATFMSKQDPHVAAARRLSSDRLENTLGSDGYWIGDFSMQRRVVSRRSYTTSPRPTAL